MLIAIAVAAVSIEARSKDCHWRSVFRAFSRVDPPLVVTPVASASWPRIRISPTPNMNPPITEADTNRISLANPRRVASSMNAPARMVRVARVRIGSAGPAFITSAVVTAAAEVVATTITVVDCSSPPAAGPANDAYSPAIGLAPASTAVAIPSGTDPIAPASPAMVSRPQGTFAISRAPGYWRIMATRRSASVSAISSPDRSRVTRLMVPVNGNAPVYSSGAAGSPPS